MSSLSKNYDQQKLLGQVYTPRWVVEKILDDLGYNQTEQLGKTIIDPACGDGRFLCVVAERVLAWSPVEKRKENLEKIYGFDIDNQAVEACIRNLNELVKNLNIAVNWNIQHCNALEKISQNDAPKFDFIVGNPPYIRIQHLSESERKWIQTRYSFCKSGSTDAYIAFYELCDFLLKEEGICGLISPNSFFYSQTAAAMRAYFAQQKTLLQITNYADIQLFENATTYCAICIFGKKPQTHFLYQQAQTAQELAQKTISFDQIINQKIWQLGLNETQTVKGQKLKDICDIHVGITTLCDKAYIFDLQDIENELDTVEIETHFAGKISIEKAILKPIIKASKLKTSADKISQYVLFPYEKVRNKHKIIPEEQLKTKFPLAYAYLCRIKIELDKRDNGQPNSVAWYAFGRSQGLDTSFGEKILFSPMNKNPNFILIKNKETTFYSGYCIKYKGDNNFLLNQLNSSRMADFISVSSRDFRGGWKAYNKKALEDFIVENTGESLQLF